jgi:hypothetical protein
VVGVTFLAIPWTVVTGSLAYNEGGMLLDGGLALVLAMGAGELPGRGRRWTWVLVGVLLGLAMGCKLTAGVFFAVPVALVMVVGGGWRSVRAVAGVALLAAVVYGPWAVRAAVYSGGNPVFPVAATWLPHRPWDGELARRFVAGHGAPVGERSFAARAGALVGESVLDKQWSPGVAAAEGWAAAWAGRKVAVEEAAGWKRVGPLWVVVGVAVVAGLMRRERRREVGVLLAVLAVQAGAWMFFTHLQGRFLLPATVPLAVLVGMGMGGGGRVRWVGGVLLGVQALAAGMLLLPEASLFLGIVGRPERSMAGMIGQSYELQIDLADALHDEPPAGGKPGKVLLVGTATPLWMKTPAVYATAFDVQPLGEALRTGGAKGAVSWMRQEGIRYVWIDTEEIERLEKSYGYDPAITPTLPGELAGAGLRDAGVPGLPPSVRLLLVPWGAVPTSAAGPGGG